MPEVKTLTWLHLSDLHLSRSRNGAQSNNIVQRLLADLRSCEKQYGLRPDFLFFTGDLVFGHIGPGPGETIEDQFHEGAAFLDLVRNSFSTAIPTENCFVIPGNHDINRSVIATSDNEWLGGVSQTTIRKMLNDNKVQWKRFAERLHSYRDFVIANGYDHPSFYDKERLLFAEKRKISGISVGIAGFNTSWSSQGDKEKGRLRMGSEWQLELLRDKLGDTDVSIALMHHPSSWLAEDEDPQFLRSIQKEFTVSLHGHEHQNWVNVDSGHLRVAAAACHGELDHLDGYNFVRIDLNNHQAQVWLRRYDPLGKTFIPNYIGNSTDSDGCWTLPNVRIGQAARHDHEQQPSAVLSTDLTAKPGVRPSTPSSSGQATIAAVEGKTAFVAVMMAGANQANYPHRHNLAQRISRFLLNRLRLSRVDCPAARIHSVNSWDPPDRAPREGLELIRKCDLFVLVYSEKAPSSVLVEAGFALALLKPSLYAVQEGIDLPYLLKSAGQAFPDVKIITFKDAKHLLRKVRTRFCFESAGLQSRRKFNHCSAALAAEGMIGAYAELP